MFHVAIIADRSEFRGLWRSRCVNPDGTIEEGWSVTFVLEGEYCEIPYEPTADRASAAALAILEGRAALGTSVDVGDVQRGRIRELEGRAETATKAASKFLHDLDEVEMRWMSENSYGAEGSVLERIRGAKSMWALVKQALKGEEATDEATR